MRIIKYLPLIVIYITVIWTSAYKVLIVQKDIYEKYNGMSGKVEWVTFYGRSGTHIMGVTLSNGTYGEVNGGNYPWKKGDTFINNMYYSPLSGITGLAYSVEPPDIPSVIWSLLYSIGFILPMIGVMVYMLYIAIRWWMRKYS